MTDWTPAQARAELEALPMPMEGPSPFDSGSDEPYELAARMTAKAMLMCADEDPTLLDIPEDITDYYARADYSAAWDKAQERWPGLDDWIGGITLNMFGWANMVVRWIHDKPPVGNPAIITIGIGKS